MLFKINKLYIFATLVLIAGCKQIPMLPGITPHRIDIQQGNAITQEMVSKLQPGMTRAQVRFVLGTPLVIDLFHNDRWDYVYTYNKRGELIEQRRMIVFFKDDKLDRIEGDVIPAKPKPDAAKPAVTPDAAKPEIAKPDAATPAPAATPAQTVVPSALTAPDSKAAGSAEIPPTVKPAAPEPAPVEKPVADKPLASPPTKPEAALNSAFPVAVSPRNDIGGVQLAFLELAQSDAASAVFSPWSDQDVRQGAKPRDGTPAVPRDFKKPEPAMPEDARRSSMPREDAIPLFQQRSGRSDLEDIRQGSRPERERTGSGSNASFITLQPFSDGDIRQGSKRQPSAADQTGSAAKKPEAPSEEKKGLFGRMLEKIGF